jgi:hypothetical protein
MSKKSKKATSVKKTATPAPTPEAAKAKSEKHEAHYGTRAGSFRRIAKAFREASVWDNHSIAAIFEAEADGLDPKHATAPAKDDLEKQTAEVKTAVEQAETTLADPNATPKDIDQASKDLEKA